MVEQKRRCLTAVVVALLLMSMLLASTYLSTTSSDDDDDDRGADTAHVFWNHCGMELINMNKAIEGIELCKPCDDDCRMQNFDEETLWKATKYLHPNMKESRRDCIMRTNMPAVVCGDQYDIWFTKYLEQSLHVSNVPRRYLASGTGGPATSPTSPHLVPSLAPSPLVTYLPPSISPALPLSPPGTGSGSQIAPTGDAPPSSHSGSYKSNSKHRSVAIAVGVTVPVTLVISALLILCYVKFCKSGSTLRRNDKRPLLSLSLQELSDGPGQNSSFAANLCNRDKRNGQVANQTNDISSFNGDLYPNSHFVSEAKSKPSEFSSFSDWSVAKPSAESHATSSNIAMNSQKPMAPPGMVKIPPPAPRPSRPSCASDASSDLPRVDSSLPHSPNVPNAPPPPLVINPNSVLPQPPMPPPPPMVKPVTSALKPPGPPAPPLPASRLSDSTPPPPPPMIKPVSAAPKPPGPPPPPLPASRLSGSPPPPPPPRPLGGSVSPHPPPPPRSGPAPPRPPPSVAPGPRPPMGPGHFCGLETESSAPKPKLKPFFWDKVLANPDSSMVWNQIKSGSFQFNEEMIETLFGSAPVDKNKNERKGDSAGRDTPIQYSHLIDIKKAQNISILLKALNLTTEEVCDALLEGHELPTELFQTLLKMAPTQVEELKLRMFNGDISQLGPAERFLKALVDIPFAFQRIECLIFATSIQEEVAITKQSFATLEVACKELKSSRLFLKLLEAVLKTGNRMNDGTFRGGAQAFKLDTLLKLSDVKGTDGKTTLLHFVVQEIIRSEGIRAACAARESDSSSSITFENAREAFVDDSEDHLRSLGIEVVSHLSSELENVKKAAALDPDSLTMSVTKLKNSLNKTHSFLESNRKSMDEASGFYQTLNSLVQNAELDVSWLVEEEERIMALVKSTGSYFHGNAGKDEGLHLFSVVRDFLIMVDKVCKEVKNSQTKPVRTARAATPSSSSTTAVSVQINREPVEVVDMSHRLIPAITDRDRNLRFG